MIRKILIIALMLAPTAGIAGDRLADLPRLKASTRVVGEYVRIGDLIENAGAAAEIAVFRSPDIGSTGTIPASRVLDAVGQHNLLIVDAAGISQVEIARESRVISVRDIENRIARALSGQPSLGDPAKLTITFDRDPRTIYVEPDVIADLQVVRSIYEPRTARFDISFSVPGSAITRATQLRYVGTIRETLEVPVLTRPINRGDIIKDADVAFERRARADVAADVIAAPESVVGLAARQALRAGVPLRRTEIVRPEVIKRGELVTIVYEVPGILLTIRGKAMEGGAEGDVINVLNTQSKRTIQGIVSGPGRVSIVAATTASPLNTAAVAASGQNE